MRDEIEDYWEQEDFEDTVAAALIACYETRVKKLKGCPPSDRLNDERIRVIRSVGPYLASNSRVIECPVDGNGEPDLNGVFTFDIDNDPLPEHGMFAHQRHEQLKPGHYHGYLHMDYVRKAKALGKYWHRRGPGQLYELLILVANDGIDGERRFFTVSNRGVVTACEQRCPQFLGGKQGQKTKIFSHSDVEPEMLKATEAWASIALQSITDRRFCWRIRAQEKIAKADLGCMQEEIKSLLYARSLPMTSTGRKRPILHLVEAHKRRMRSGIDVDVSAFLRGQQTVEMGGTLFSVLPPQAIKANLSKPSQRRNYQESAV